MNTPKTFEPVVTSNMLCAATAALVKPMALASDAFSAMCSHPDFQRQLRAYAAEVARQMVPDAMYEAGYLSPPPAYRAEGHNACRAATLSAIDEWEKGE